MPINDPIQNRKVAPGSLAFERRRMVYGPAYAGEEPEGDVYNYQYYIDLNYNITINNIITKPMLQSESLRLMNSMSNAEHRAKPRSPAYRAGALLLSYGGMKSDSAVSAEFDDAVQRTAPHS